MTYQPQGDASREDVATLCDFLLGEPSVTAGLRRWTGGALTFTIVRRGIRCATPDEVRTLGRDVGLVQHREIQFGNTAGTPLMTARAVVALRHLPWGHAIRVCLGRRPLGDVLSPLGFERVRHAERIMLDMDVPLEQTSVLLMRGLPVAVLTERYRRAALGYAESARGGAIG